MHTPTKGSCSSTQSSAKLHFDAFKELFTDPDPELEWMLEDAKAAIRDLENES